jgi:hypothetical protein
MMKILFASAFASILGLGLAVSATTADAQIRAQRAREEAEQRASNTLGAMTLDEDKNFFTTLFDKANWSTQQQYSFSYSSNGQQSVGLSMFTNRFTFKPSDDMRFSADVSAVYSPFASFGNNALNSDIQKQINGIYLTNARMDWKLGESTFMTIQYNGGPQNQQFDPFYSPWNRYSDPFAQQNERSTMISGQAGFGSNGWRTTSTTVTRR